MESRRTLTRGEVVSVQPTVAHIGYPPQILNIATHLGGPPHEGFRQLEMTVTVHKHARLVDKYPNGISNIPGGTKILLCPCLGLLLLPFRRQRL